MRQSLSWQSGRLENITEKAGQPKHFGNGPAWKCIRAKEVERLPVGHRSLICNGTRPDRSEILNRVQAAEAEALTWYCFQFLGILILLTVSVLLLLAVLSELQGRGQLGILCMGVLLINH